MKLLARILLVALALIGVGALIVGALALAGGISARAQPGRIETMAARRLRAVVIPRAAHDRKNPVRASAEVLREGMGHFADHCAVCHGNDGSGDTEMGRGLYPRPPDMRREATQALSDGALFYIIENGVRLTGMPAWGNDTPKGMQASWHLVHFVRHLPKLTEEELAEMSNLNPTSADEWRQEEEARRFLEPGAAATKPTMSGHGHPGGKR
jgi:mono/diheme cytochrome c family protein